MAAKKREIYARCAVQLRTHERAFQAERMCPGAMGLYLFLLLDSRGEQTFGDVAEVVALSSWGAPTAYRKKQAEALIAVGFIERRAVAGADRLVVVKYDEHNDTPEDIESNKAKARERMEELRAKRKAEKAALKAACSGDVRRTEGERSPDVPISSSISISLSDLSGRDPEPDRSPTPIRFQAGTAPAHRAREVFEDAVAEAIGGTFALTTAPFHDRDLCLVLTKHGPKGSTITEALSWLGDTVQAWVAATPDGDDRKPARLNDWLNAKRPARGARSGRAAEITKQPFDPDAPWMKLTETGS